MYQIWSHAFQEGRRRQLVLERPQAGVALARDRDFEDAVEFRAQGVEEERVDDFVDVLDGGVVHAAGAAGLGVERALEDGAEDGRRDFRPVEAQGGFPQDGFAQAVRELRDFHGAGEERAVDVGERREGGLEVGGTFFARGVEWEKGPDPFLRPLLWASLRPARAPHRRPQAARRSRKVSI